MKTSWIVVGLILLIIVAYAGWQSTRPDAILEVLQPQIGTIRAYVEEQAVTELPYDYLIGMPINGWLEPIGLREGDAVAEGAVVARLDQADLRDRVLQAEHRLANLETKIRETQDHRLEHNALEEIQATVVAIDKTVEAAEAKLVAAKAVADFAASEVQRIEGIQDADAATEREMREAITTMRKTEAEYRSDILELAALKTLAAVSYIGPKFIRDYIDRKSFTIESYTKQLEEAKAQLEIERRNLARAQITSPTDGVVLARLQTRRQFLAAGTPLLTVGRLDDLEVIAEVLTERATRVSPGDPVEIFGETLAGGPIAGTVSRVYPAGFTKISSLGVEQQRVKVAINLDQRPDRLGVDFRVYVRIYYDHVEGAIILPRTTLFRSGRGTWQVMVVRAGHTALQPVEVGLMNDDSAEIKSGLSLEDLVIARPSREITPNLRVETTSANFPS